MGRMAVRLITSGDAHEAGKEEYEGSSDDSENKGAEAAMSAVEMVNLLSALRS